MTQTQHINPLPIRWPAIRSTLARHKMATASQLRRLHYTEGTPRSQAVICSRNLKRLTELGKVRRVYGVHDYRQPEYVYTLPNTLAKPNDHTLDLTELWVQLAPFGAIFTPEPWSHMRVGMAVLRPDGFVETGDKRRFIELDRDTEHPAKLKSQMRHYYTVWRDEWNPDVHGSKWPTVVWVVHSRDRMIELRRIIKAEPEPNLHSVMLFDEAVEKLLIT